jgi:hypothetical protein
MEAAMMAMPTSTLDQMTRSTVAKRKSDEVDIWWIALTRIKVATLPTFARLKRRKTETLVRRFMFKPLTKKAGRIPKVQSPIDETIAWEYVNARMILGPMQ